MLLLLLLENSINRYLIKKKNYKEFIYIPINLCTHNLWATRRLEIQRVWRGAKYGVSGAGGEGCISFLTEAKQKGTVHRRYFNVRLEKRIKFPPFEVIDRGMRNYG